jgi:hypothetical protein
MGSHDGGVLDSPWLQAAPTACQGRRPSEAFFGAAPICLMRVVIRLAGRPVWYRFPVLPEPHLISFAAAPVSVQNVRLLMALKAL